MPSHDQVRALVHKGVPFQIAESTDVVNVAAVLSGSQATAANPTASAQPVATDLATTTALANELRTQMGQVVTQNTELKTKLNATQSDLAAVRSTLNNLIAALKKNGTTL